MDSPYCSCKPTRVRSKVGLLRPRRDDLLRLQAAVRTGPAAAAPIGNPYCSATALQLQSLLVVPTAAVSCGAPRPCSCGPYW